jgi:hypothetical protein
MYLVSNFFWGIQSLLRAGGLMQPSELDLKVAAVREKVESHKSRRANFMIDDTQWRNLQHGMLLNLSDLKVAYQGDTALYQWIVESLDLNSSIYAVNQEIPFLERIQEVSDSILQHVNLFSMQNLRYPALVDSIVWYVLASDDKFLNRPINDLSKLKGTVWTAAQRIEELYERNSALFSDLAEDSLGAIRNWSVVKLNKDGCQLPPKACALASFERAIQVDFGKFSSEQLTEMVEGRENGEFLLSNMSVPQRTLYYKKTLSSTCGSYITGLDFSEMTMAHQVEELLSDGRLEKDEKARRIQQVPAIYIPHIQKLCKESFWLHLAFFPNLTEEQIQHLDAKELTEDQVQLLFPGFTLETLYPGRTIRKEMGLMVFEDGGTSSRRGPEEVEQMIAERRAECLSRLKVLTPEQKEILKEKVHPEVRALLEGGDV